MAYFLNEAVAKARYGNSDTIEPFEAPLTSLVWPTSIISIVLTYIVSYPSSCRSWAVMARSGGSWQPSSPAECWPAPSFLSLVKVFTSTESRHVREVVTSADEGGASLGILSGFVAGNFSCYYLGFTMVALMSVGYYVSNFGLGALMLAPAVFAFGLVAFGFLGMGPW